MERIVSMIKYKSMDEVPTEIMSFSLKLITMVKLVMGFNG
jgi:hypothetical protein